MKITIKNCNNIDTGVVTVVESKLNIKFGINGTGKSTISKAINYSVNNPEKLTELLPFKSKINSEIEKQPNISIDPEGKIKSVLIFNEEYLNQFVYKQDELISNSFEIFIKTPRYTETTNNIEKQLEAITNIFLKNKELERIISDFESLSKSFKTTQKGLSDASAISKGLKDGNKMENIPDDLLEYKPFLQDKEKCVSWIDWQTKGNNFSDGHDNCPYCVAPTDESKKKKIKAVSQNYDKNIIRNFIVIIDAINDLGDYFSELSKEKLNEILKKTDGLLDEEKTYITTIKGQIDAFLQKLKNLKSISFKDFKDDEKINQRVSSFIIDIDELFDKLKSEQTIKIVDNFNGKINEILKKIGKLQGEVNKQKEEVKKLIEKNKKDINQFLQNAGYKYEVIIIDDQGEYKIKLKHIDSNKSILGGSQHLSFGEKNAFALVLFMYQALSEKPDLIILDDPISSFDKNKKYAIMDMLFKTKNCLKSKTVLMLTHDIEPIIDTIKIPKKFKGLVNANFLFLKVTELKEKPINKEDLLTFSQICTDVIKTNTNPLIKVIYLRRYYEVIDDKGNEYEILSNLLHKRPKEKLEDHRVIRGGKKMSPEDVSDGMEKIQKIFSGFDYDNILEIIRDKESLKKVYNESKNGYEKLQIFRILNDNSSNNVLKNFINESYHIENEFIYQLNHTDFDLIPSFVVDECDKSINSRQ